MAEYLIQKDTMTAFANQVRRLSNTEDSLYPANMLETLSRIQGTVKTDGDHFVKAVAYGHGDMPIKSGMYDEGMIFALAERPNLNLAHVGDFTFQEWVAPVPLSADFFVVGGSDMTIGAICTPNDGSTTIQTSVLESGRVVGLWLFNGTTVDWGDGNVEKVPSDGAVTHTYSDSQQYYIKIFGGISTCGLLNGVDVDPFIMSIYFNDTGYNHKLYGPICSNISSIKYVAIPNGITSIGDYAFSGCNNLKSVIIPSSISDIPSYAFNYCTSLKDVVLPYGLTDIGYRAFADCTSLESIVIPGTISNVGTCVFENCSSLTSVVLCEGITSISGQLFTNCVSLSTIGPLGSGASIEIPNSVTSIDDYAFYHRYATYDYPHFTEVVLPPSVTNIGDCAFFNQFLLKKVVLMADTICSIVPQGDDTCSGSFEFYNTTFYVPDNLVDSYKADTNWSNYASRIKPLSEYVSSI